MTVVLLSIITALVSSAALVLLARRRPLAGAVYLTAGLWGVEFRHLLGVGLWELSFKAGRLTGFGFGFGADTAHIPTEEIEMLRLERRVKRGELSVEDAAREYFMESLGGQVDLILLEDAIEKASEFGVASPRDAA